MRRLLPCCGIGQLTRPATDENLPHQKYWQVRLED
jgi:hypothetical protein